MKKASSNFKVFMNRINDLKNINIKFINKQIYVFKIIFSIFIMIFLFSCNSIEKRTEKISKKDLPKISNKIKFNSIWSKNVGSGVANTDANIVLFKDKNVLYTADHNGLVFAVDKNTGKNIWKINLGKNITSGPYVKSGFVALSCGEDEIVILNSKDGSVVWKSKIKSEVLASPVIYQDKVYIHSLDGRIICLDLKAGSKVWEHGYSLPSIILRKSCQPVIKDNNLYLGLANGKLISMDIFTGNIVWIADISENLGKSDLKRMADIVVKPIVEEQDIYVVGYQSRLAKIYSDTGNVVWDLKLSSFSGITADKGKVYVATERGHVKAFSKNTGNEIWDFDLLEGRILSSPVIYKGKIIVGDEDGNVYFLSAKNAELLAIYKLGDKGMNAEPLFDKDIIYLLSRGGKIVALKICD